MSLAQQAASRREGGAAGERAIGPRTEPRAHLTSRPSPLLCSSICKRYLCLHLPGPLPNLMLKVAFCLFLSPLNTCPQGPVCFHTISFLVPYSPFQSPSGFPYPISRVSVHQHPSSFLITIFLPSFWFCPILSPRLSPWPIFNASQPLEPICHRLCLSHPPLFWSLTHHCLLSLCPIPGHFHSLHSCPQVYPRGILIFIPYAPSSPVPNPSPRPSLP